MPIIQHLGTAISTGSPGFNNPITDNLQVWLDPRNWSSPTANQDASFGTGSISSGTWRIWNADGAFVSGTDNQGVEPATAGTNMCTFTYGQSIPNMMNLENYSMQFWIYVGTQNHGSWGYIGGKSAFWGSNDAGVFINANGTDWGFHTSSDGSLNGDMHPNGWHNICIVRDLSASNCRKMYVDGSLYLQDNGGDNDPAHKLNYSGGLSVLCHSNGNATGTGYPVGSNGFKFGHCLFYSDALSASEQQDNYLNSKAVYGL